MRILGVDPGYAIVGFGVLEYTGTFFTPITYGAITTAAEVPFSERLERIYRDFQFLLQQYQPDSIAMERLYFTSNQKTVIDVAQARGVLMLTAQLAQIPVAEYTPLQVKQAVVGYGRAEKKQVMELTRRILKLQKIPRPDDAADALAIAICHGHCATGLQGRMKIQQKAERKI
ncbi:MAG: crossover junction endodeoxyribonuclease RuvC [Oscillospiraceae bacterium]|nr:crossover junction endodeoxyribonuclease RuvC [Oscillospiraceae bacterium]